MRFTAFSMALSAFCTMFVPVRPIYADPPPAVSTPTESTEYELQVRELNLTDATATGSAWEAPAKSRFKILGVSNGVTTYGFTHRGPSSDPANTLIRLDDRYSGNIPQSDYQAYQPPMDISEGPLVVPFKIIFSKGSAVQLGATLGGCISVGRKSNVGEGAFFLGGGLAVDSAGNGNSGASTGVTGAAGVTFTPTNLGQIGVVVGYDHGVAGTLNDKWWLSFSFTGFPSASK